MAERQRKDKPKSKNNGQDPKGRRIPPRAGGVFLVLALGALAVAMAYRLTAPEIPTVTHKEAGLNEVVALYKSGAYEKIEVKGATLTATRRSRDLVGDKMVLRADQVTLPGGANTLKDLGFDLSDNKTKFTVQDSDFEKAMWELLPTVLGIGLMAVILIMVLGKIGGGAGGPMAFGRSKAKMFDPNKNKFTFADVAGGDEEKEELKEFVDFLKEPKKYRALGAKIPRGVLMVGAPGTGKTLLARAVAGESGVPFFYVSGSEFVEMFVGVGAARVRDLFKEAREKSPSIVFIDEIDAIGKRRAAGMGGGHDEREQTLNQILTEMDGFDNETHVIVMAATNRVDVLDRALLRPGRFDRKVTINLPTLEDRIKILELHAKGKPVDAAVDWRAIASVTAGMSGADLANILNEAAILAGRASASAVTQAMIQKAVEKVSLGNTKKSLRLSEREKKIVAFHEVGHALLAKTLPWCDAPHKVSVIARGGSLGVTWTPAERDQVLTPKAKFLDDICMVYGGRAAEEVFFGQDVATTGASSDIQSASQMAREMVTRYGFDEELGAQDLTDDRTAMDGLPNLTSEKTREAIDLKIRAILRQQLDRAKKTIESHRTLHEKIATELMTREELTRQEFDAYFDGMEMPAKALS